MSNDLRTAFRQMFGIQKEHDFQIEVAEQLLIHRKSVILQAPTGSGKTWTALFPFLHAWQSNISFPRKCLYAVPLRVLATQFKENAEQIVHNWSEMTRPRISLQTGEQQDDLRFESALIFTTIDQMLSSALNVPYSLSYRQSNINAGAVFSSFLVCDELHLFPVDEQRAQGALATLMELLRLFGDTMPFLLMTATLSDAMVQQLERMLGAKRVVVGEKELQQIESQQKTRRYHVVDAPLTAEAILAQHQRRSIAICNQVQRAIDLYDELCEHVENDPAQAGKTRIQLLHSRFTKDHRSTKESTIRRQFGKPIDDESRDESLIVVATQAIEVGLDITCERLHTELAPANAIIQRAGRCARYKDEEGEVLIYRWLADASQPHLPYDAARCETTWTAFSDPSHNGQALSFNDEQQIVTAVHDPVDTVLLNKMRGQRYSLLQDIRQAQLQGERENRARLIRQVDSRTVLVHNHPEQIHHPYGWRGFSLFHGTLRGWLQQLREERGLEPWMVRYPVEVGKTDESDPLQDVKSRVKYHWEPVTHEELINVSPLFVIHPDLVAYDAERGFRLMRAEQAIELAELAQEPDAAEQKRFVTRYTLESYAKHIDNILQIYRGTHSFEQQMLLAGERLERAGYPCTAEQFERAVRLALALHDIGKLRVEWQDWSHAYQAHIGKPQAASMMIVHTDYQPDQTPLHKQAEEALKGKRRPHHAAEGACASWPVILAALDGNEWLSRPVFTAIARHHAPFVVDAEEFRLHTGSMQAVAEALDIIGVPTQLAQSIKIKQKRLPSGSGLSRYFIRSDDGGEWLAYSLIVRTLRLCDGLSLEGAA